MQKRYGEPNFDRVSIRKGGVGGVGGKCQKTLKNSIKQREGGGKQQKCET